MENTEYELMNKTQDIHWWYLGRRKIIKTIIENNIAPSKKLSIADAGCGFGGNIPMLKQYGNVTGLELNEKAILEVRKKWGDSIELIKWKSPEKLNKKFDLILLSDVLEHISNDQEAVSWIYEHLNDGGYALLTVPAHKFFWSQMDEVAYHYRRYGRKNFLNLFKDKFIIKKFSFYDAFLFPIKIAFVIFSHTTRFLFPKKEKRSYNDIPPKIINACFKYILYFESELIKQFSLPFGISMIILVQKSLGGKI